MAKRQDYEAKTEELLIPIINDLSFELVDVEYVKEGNDYYLRAYIDKEGGITIDDCETVSRRLELILDEKDFISDAYILEVSSPGLGRQLKKEKDYLRSIGKEVDIRLYKPIDKVKEMVGILKSYKEQKFVFEVDGRDIEIELSQISRLNLHFEI